MILIEFELYEPQLSVIVVLKKYLKLKNPTYEWIDYTKKVYLHLRFLNEYNLSLLNRDITDGEPANNSYEILKFWPILSLAIFLKRILIKKRCTP